MTKFEDQPVKLFLPGDEYKCNKDSRLGDSLGRQDKNYVFGNIFDKSSSQVPPQMNEVYHLDENNYDLVCTKILGDQFSSMEGIRLLSLEEKK
tara:strand:+ start:103 stop:381 length:279 start_codon:yes stop_codon:yes gene_type:complete